MSTIYSALGFILIFGFLDILTILSIVDDFKEYKQKIRHQELDVVSAFLNLVVLGCIVQDIEKYKDTTKNMRLTVSFG